MPKIIHIQELKPSSMSSSDYIVFGGTFDPIHMGHVSVIRHLMSLFQVVLLAPTSQNPWKSESPTPLALRVEMIRLVLEAEGIPMSKDSAIYGTCGVLAEDYKYSAELVDILRKRYSGHAYWAVGEDSASGTTKWKDWGSKGVTVVSVPITVPVHSTDVRANIEILHAALHDFAKAHHLYGL